MHAGRGQATGARDVPRRSRRRATDLRLGVLGQIWVRCARRGRQRRDGGRRDGGRRDGRCLGRRIRIVIPRPLLESPTSEPAERPHPDRVVDDARQHRAARGIARDEPDQDREEAEDDERPDEEFHERRTPRASEPGRSPAAAILASGSTPAELRPTRIAVLAQSVRPRPGRLILQQHRCAMNEHGQIAQPARFSHSGPRSCVHADLMLDQHQAGAVGATGAAGAGAGRRPVSRGGRARPARTRRGQE